MDETARMVITIVGAGGGTAFVTALIKGWGNWRSGAAHREQLQNTSLAAQTTQAVADRKQSDKERDEADDRRREAEEHVAILQRQLILEGIKPLERP